MCKSSQTPPSMLFGHHSYYLHIHQITSSFTSTHVLFVIVVLVVILCVGMSIMCCSRCCLLYKSMDYISECLPWIVVMRQTN